MLIRQDHVEIAIPVDVAHIQLAKAMAMGIPGIQPVDGPFEGLPFRVDASYEKHIPLVVRQEDVGVAILVEVNQLKDACSMPQRKLGNDLGFPVRAATRVA